MEKGEYLFELAKCFQTSNVKMFHNFKVFSGPIRKINRCVTKLDFDFAVMLGEIGQ